MPGNRSRSCPLCGGNRFQTCFEDTFSPSPEAAGGVAAAVQEQRFAVLKCVKCGLTFREPQQSRDAVFPNMGRGYLPATEETSPTSAGAAFMPEIAVSPEHGQREIEEITRFAHPPGTFLNIGRDGADILETARLQGWNSASVTGWQPVSAEKSETHLERTLNKLKYDVVRLEGVLENVLDPRAMLDHVSRMLQQNGLLVISTPDCSEWDFSLFGQGTTLFAPELPYWFFTPRTLKRLLNVCDYEVLKTTTFQITYEISGGTNFRALPPDIGNDGFSDGFSPTSAPLYARYFRTLARVDEKRIGQRSRKQMRERAFQEISEPVDPSALVPAE